ncbi:hypothetical protein HS125_18955 [bacterium]|nr:hypothetical protein [bacterium]
MPFNLSDYMGPFLDEADEQLAALSEGLLALEINPATRTPSSRCSAPRTA